MNCNYECNNNVITNIYRGIEWALNSKVLFNCNFNHNNISTTNSNDNCLTAIYIHGPINSTVKSDSELNIDFNSIIMYPPI